MKIRCKFCNDVIKGDNKGTYIQCKCGACYIDQTEHYTRIGGNFVDIEAVIPFDEYNELLEENKQLKEEIKQLERNIKIKDKWCKLIIDLGFDYDGCEKPESLKKLIDELVTYAYRARENDDKSVAYTNEKREDTNILGEPLESSSDSNE